MRGIILFIFTILLIGFTNGEFFLRKAKQEIHKDLIIHKLHTASLTSCHMECDTMSDCFGYGTESDNLTGGLFDCFLIRYDTRKYWEKLSSNVETIGLYVVEMESVIAGQRIISEIGISFANQSSTLTQYNCQEVGSCGADKAHDGDLSTSAVTNYNHENASWTATLEKEVKLDRIHLYLSVYESNQGSYRHLIVETKGAGVGDPWVTCVPDTHVVAESTGPNILRCEDKNTRAKYIKITEGNPERKYQGLVLNEVNIFGEV